MNKAEKVRVSFRVEEALWKKFKIHCIENNTNMSEKLAKLIEEEVEK